MERLTTKQYWDKIYNDLTLKQYVKITNNAELKYENYFINILKYTKSAKLHNLAQLGLLSLTKVVQNGK